MTDAPLKLERLPFHASPPELAAQAEAAFHAYLASDPTAIGLCKQHHPQFRHPEIRWRPLPIADPLVRAADLSLADAQLALARWYDFRDWPALMQFAESVASTDSAVYAFESAADAVVAGELSAVRQMLGDNPALAAARSTRVTHFDPPVHRATLLHYVAANGVESFRQRTPPNAVEIARALLEANAEVDSLASCYGGEWTTLSLLVSSCHPATAGLQSALVETLIDFGAALTPRGAGRWQSPLLTALVFGYRDAAAALARRGAPVDGLVVAAGLGRIAESRAFLGDADADARRRALALAASNGQVQVLELLLDAGEDPNRFNPPAMHEHSTPLHQAVCNGHQEAVRLLVDRGARTDIRDSIYDGTPLDWAEHCGHPAIARYLRGDPNGPSSR